MATTKPLPPGRRKKRVSVNTTQKSAFSASPRLNSPKGRQQFAAPGTVIKPSTPGALEDIRADGELAPEINADITPDFADDLTSLEDDQNDAGAPELDHNQGVEKSENANVEDGQETAANEAEQELIKDPQDDQQDPDEQKTFRTRLKQKASDKKKKWAIAAASVSSAIAVVGAIAFLPNFVMKQATEKLKGYFMDKASYALEKRAEVYMVRYVRDVVAKAQIDCGVKIARDCNNFTPGRSIMGRTFTSWRETSIEDKLFKRQGLEFEVDRRRPDRITVFKTVGGVRTEVGDFGKNSVVKEVFRAMENETKFSKIVDRRHVRSIISNKYGGKKYCIIACAQRDEYDDKKFNRKENIKLKLAARVVEPVSSRAAAYMLCFVTGCSPAELERTSNTFAREIIEKTDNDLLKEVGEEFAKSNSRNLSEFTTKRVTEKILTSVMSQTTAKAATSAIPLAGQVYLVITIADLFDRIDQSIENKELSKFIRKLNEEAYVTYGTAFLSASDDVQSFEAPFGDMGAMFSMMSGFSASRLSQGISGTSPKSSIECDDGVVLSGEDDPLVCPEKQIQPTLAIEEIRNNPDMARVFDLTNEYGRCYGGETEFGCLGVRPRTVIRPILRGIDWALGAASDAALKVAAAAFPPLGAFMGAAEDLAERTIPVIVEAVAKSVFKIAVDVTAEGYELFDQYAGSLDVISNAFAKGYEDESGQLIGLGAPEITEAQEARLNQAIAQERKEEMQTRSIFARYFNINESESLAANATYAFAGTIMSEPSFIPEPSQLNPSGTLQTIAGLFGMKRATAADNIPSRKALFGNSQYAFPVDDQALSVDPDSLTEEACEAYEEDWRESEETDEDTGETKYTVSNPCMLDAVVADALTKVYDLDPPEARLAAGGGGVPSELVAGTPLEGRNTNTIPCHQSPTVGFLREEPEAYIDGERYTINLCNVHGVSINSIASKSYDDMFNAMAAAGYTVRGSGGFRDMASQVRGYAGGAGAGTFARPGFSNHQYGVAVDISCQGGGQSYSQGTGRGRASFLAGVAEYPCLEWIASNSQNYGLLLQCVGSNSSGGEIRGNSGGCEWWHVSPTGG